MTFVSPKFKMAATAESRTCGSCCVKLKELIGSYEEELGLKGNQFDGTKVHAFGSLNFYLEHSKFTDLLNSIRLKCQSCTGWPDSAKAIRASLERQQQAENFAPIKSYISECLDKLQNAMKDSSIKGVVQRLEAITRKVGLKFIDNGTGRDCFINSDMFYVEVQMEADGRVSEVKVAHAGDPESCPELTRVLREGDYEEFLCHLQGLCDLYQLSRDTFQKSKILAALKAVEIDINTMAGLFGTGVSSTEAITHCPVGFVTPRQGGRLMRLTYFASPYDLLDVDRPGKDRHFTKDSPPPRDFGYQVCVSLEQSQKSLLPTMPLIEDPMTYGILAWDSSIKYQALNDNNSEEFQASFVLQLGKPLPTAVEVVHKIYGIVSKTGTFTHSSRVPIDNLIIREWLKEKKIPDDENRNTFYASLPQHYHVYHVTETQRTPEEPVETSGMGVLLYRIGFNHPSHIPEILEVLRRQAMFNTLLTSALRSHKPLKKKPESKEYVFELRASGPFTLTVNFEHPCTPGMASIDFHVSPHHTVEASLNTVPGQPLFCSNDYISRVIQRCLSIPAAMRCIIRKAESVKPEDLPVKVCEDFPLPVGIGQPTTKLANLSPQPNAALFGAALGTSSNPTTPGFLGASPSFTTPFSLETPSPTFTFPFTSISPTFSFSTVEVAAATSDAATAASRQPEKKVDTPKNPALPNLKITLKRKRDDEYVIENFQLPEDIPKNVTKPTTGHGVVNAPKPGNAGMSNAAVPDNLVDTVHSSFDLSAVSAANISAGFVLGPNFPDVAAGLDGSGVSSATNVIAAGQQVGMGSSSNIASTSGLGIVTSAIEGLAASTDLFDIGAAGADGTDLEGILQNLSGASHLPPGIVPAGASLDFDTALGPGVSGLDVTDPGFDIDAAIDASAAADPSIAGTAGAFDVDSTLDFDLEHIAAGATAGMTDDLLSVGGLGRGDGSVDMDLSGTSQPKM